MNIQKKRCGVIYGSHNFSRTSTSRHLSLFFLYEFCIFFLRRRVSIGAAAAVTIERVFSSVRVPGGEGSLSGGQKCQPATSHLPGQRLSSRPDHDEPTSIQQWGGAVIMRVPGPMRGPGVPRPRWDDSRATVPEDRGESRGGGGWWSRWERTRRRNQGARGGAVGVLVWIRRHPLGYEALSGPLRGH